MEVGGWEWYLPLKVWGLFSSVGVRFFFCFLFKVDAIKLDL